MVTPVTLSSGTRQPQTTLSESTRSSRMLVWEREMISATLVSIYRTSRKDNRTRNSGSIRRECCVQAALSPARRHSVRPSRVPVSCADQCNGIETYTPLSRLRMLPTNTSGNAVQVIIRCQRQVPLEAARCQSLPMSKSSVSQTSEAHASCRPATRHGARRMLLATSSVHRSVESNFEWVEWV